MTEFANIREKRSLIFYCYVNFEWVREAYTVCCTRNEGTGFAWLKIWKLRGLRKGFEKGRCYEYIIKMFGNEGVEGTISVENG
jgi:hypothetical protein